MTLPELIVVIAVIALLLGMLLPALLKARRNPVRIKCVNNLKNVSLAFRIFATDNSDQFPMQMSGAAGGSKEFVEDEKRIWSHFAAMSNELSTPKILICPDDSAGRKEAMAWPMTATNSRFRTFNKNANISYFVGVNADESKPMTLLTGDRNITNNDPVVFRYGKAQVGNLGTNHSRTSGAGWDPNVHKNQGHGALGDGSVQQMSSERWRTALRDSGDPNNRIAVPD